MMHASSILHVPAGAVECGVAGAPRPPRPAPHIGHRASLWTKHNPNYFLRETHIISIYETAFGDVAAWFVVPMRYADCRQDARRDARYDV
jgi:hypothetical protein